MQVTAFNLGQGDILGIVYPGVTQEAGQAPRPLLKGGRIGLNDATPQQQLEESIPLLQSEVASEHPQPEGRGHFGKKEGRGYDLGISV